ncbi:MAG: DsbA family protein [Verrucomicrobiota bacterium]|jgi:predicted DsbA family dithiol-disulfide isomerase
MSAAPRLSATYFLDVLSSWCHWAEPAWQALRQRYGDAVSFQWKIALMDPAGIPANRGQCDWFYRRSGVITRANHRLSSAWLVEGVRDYSAPNLVAEAARDLGADDDRARLAMAHAAMVEGQRVDQIAMAARIAALATGLDADLLAAHAATDAVLRRVKETTDEFVHLGATQRPTFVLENDIGDRAVLSGFHGFDPLAAAIDALLADSQAYASWEVHFGSTPTRDDADAGDGCIKAPPTRR